ncbi:MAG: hypothetical protein IAE92_13105 [Burkholderiaceae bacterium]|nr:hypothetical protein [Burkholderiaceae bacterium]
MKTTVAAALMLMASTALLAQTPAAPAKAPAPKSTTAKKVKQPKASPPSDRETLKSATNQVAAGIRAAEVALTPAELEIASRVQTGQMPCELGASVKLEADSKMPGYFDLTGKGFKYRLHVVETSTGAIRLEDKHEGAVWLQLANKSMLMDQKAGKRLADECTTPTQVAVAEELKKNPPPSLIDTPVGARKP